MKFGIAVKEKIARVIAEYFTTNQIVNVFTDANIPTDTSLYAKWRITLDAFSKMSVPEESIPHILGVFCHPLNFEDPQTRKDMMKKLNAILAYENLEIKATDRAAEVVSTDGTPIGSSASTIDTKTSTDYIFEAITFFKNEYNKVRMSGLTYEYSIGENPKSEQTGQDYDEYDARLKAIERLKNAGFITEYTLEERVENQGYYIWDYAICKIDEGKITQQEAPRATDAGVQNLTQKMIHEHTHRFENSIQEKGIDLNHKFDGDKKGGLYIIKEGDDFSYKGRYVNLSKKTDYYKVFCALYSKLPNGGEVSYKDLIAEIKSRLHKTQSMTDDEMKKFIQRNLTDKSNGFMRYAGIPQTEDSGKPLIEVIRGSGIIFNNKLG